MEQLICTDPALSALDGQLAQIYSAQRQGLPEGQRAALVVQERLWEQARYELCQVPTVMTEWLPMAKLHQQMLSCVTGLYQQRLRQLQGRSAVAVPAEMDKLPAGWTSPACVALMIPSLRQGKSTSVSTGRCGALVQHNPLIGLPQWGYLVNGLNADWTGFSQQLSRNWVSVLPVDPLNLKPDSTVGQLWLVRYLNGPGLKTASAIVRLDRQADLIHMTPVFQAGDRCAGGIAQAHQRTDGGLNLDLSIGDVGVLRMISGKGYLDPEGAPWECFAQVSLQLDAQQVATIIGLELNEPASQLKENDCMTLALKKVPPTTGSTGYEASTFTVLNREYNTCRDQGVAAGIAD